MKNVDILVMYDSGILNITNNELGPKSAYKILKFRKAIQTAYQKIQDLEKSLLSDSGIDDPTAFDSELKSLRENTNKTEEEVAKLNEMNDKLINYLNKRKEMLNDDTELDGIKTIPYED